MVSDYMETALSNYDKALKKKDDLVEFVNAQMTPATTDEMKDDLGLPHTVTFS